METIREAFDYARNTTLCDLTFWDLVRDYVDLYSNDRRYKLHVKASSSDNRSAIVEYRSMRYYLAHDYVTNSYTIARI